MKRFLDRLYRSGHYQRVLLTAQARDDKAALLQFSVELQGAF
jgi:hypothetical protein